MNNKQKWNYVYTKKGIQKRIDLEYMYIIFSYKNRLSAENQLRWRSFVEYFNVNKNSSILKQVNYTKYIQNKYKFDCYTPTYPLWSFKTFFLSFFSVLGTYEHTALQLTYAVGISILTNKFLPLYCFKYCI